MFLHRSNGLNDVIISKIVYVRPSVRPSSVRPSVHREMSIRSHRMSPTGDWT